MVKWRISILIFIIIFANSSCNIKSDGFDVYVDKLPVGVLRNYILNSSKEYIIEVLNLSNNIKTVPPRIFLNCKECKENHPLLVVVRQNKGVLSWELPVVIGTEENHLIYTGTERTLCPFDIMNTTTFCSNCEMYNNDKIHPVTLSLSTSSEVNIGVEVSINLEKDFVLSLNSNTTAKVNPSSPAFYLYEFPPEDEKASVLLRITSDDDICMIVSIQNVSCPVFDLEQNVQYKGHFQSVTRQGGQTLTKEAFPNGFYVVLIVTGKDSYCSSRLFTDSMERTKNVVLSLSKTISPNEYKEAIAITFTVISIFCLSMFIYHFICYVREKKSGVLIDSLLDDEQQPSSSIPPHSQQNFDASPISPSPYTPGTDTLSIKTDSSLDETDYDLAADAEFDKNIFRMKTYLYVCDLARKNQTVLKKKTETYFWNLLTIAIFYFLPVIQLVFTNQFQLNQSGREDLCYYNFLCSHPFWIFSDFNHVFSNIAYIFFGSLFLLLTVMKERLYSLKIASSKRFEKLYGIPQHFGLFYAMGAALIIEGVLSACYHVCPNIYNFQFDSSFMYVISTLCMIKIYQTRHPDINATAYSTFFFLAGIIILGMVGVLFNDQYFWIIFTILHLTTCFYLSVQIYYIGRWKLGCAVFIRFFKELRSCHYTNWRYFLPTFPSRFILLCFAIMCNVGLAVGSFVFNIRNFWSYLLTIFMVNLVLYITFYIIMKFVCKERLSLQSIVYILLSILGWAAALYFFLNRTISWRLTPAESKLFNQPCQLLGFYDYHDIWHFISAAALFFSFMVLLTLDDDVAHIHRSKILVF